jgi:hypothetical protein
MCKLREGCAQELWITLMAVDTADDNRERVTPRRVTGGLMLLKAVISQWLVAVSLQIFL